MMKTQMYAELITQESQTLLPHDVCTHTHTSVWGAWCQVGGASAPPVLSSDRLTTGGRRTGESFTNGGRSRPSSCLDILWRERRREEERGREEEKGGREGSREKKEEE